MSVSPAALHTQIQDIKAQSLATMMSIVGGAAEDGTGGDGGKPVTARIVAMSEAGRMMLALPGGTVDLEIPPWLSQAAKNQPGLLIPGKTIPALVDDKTGTLRLVLPDASKEATQPALRLSLSPDSLKAAHGPAAVQTPLPRAALFPAGTAGDAVEKLTGLRLPLAERAEATALPGLRLKPGGRADGQRIAQAFTPALAELVLAAALKQGPVAPALSALIASLEDGTLPPEARDAVRALAANRLDALTKLQPEALDSAVRRSGLTLEAQLLKADSAPATLDLKAALLTLKALMARAQGEAGAPARATPADLPRLIEGAIERITLQQVASLPEHHEMRVTDDRASGFRISTSLPLAMQGLDRPQTAMIGLMVEHHPHGVPAAPDEAEPEGSNGAAEPFPWKVRIALDLAETGPVEAEIRLRAQTVSITLWAERKSTAATARDEIGQLHKALEAAQFDVSRLDVRDGRPTGKPARSRMALDRTS